MVYSFARAFRNHVSHMAGPSYPLGRFERFSIRLHTALIFRDGIIIILHLLILTLNLGVERHRLIGGLTCPVSTYDRARGDTSLRQNLT